MLVIKRFLNTIMLANSPFIIVKEPLSAGVIQLNRPKALNALTPEMFE
jgi:enoyl-CoA hydratase/carnithine racemase